MQMSVFLLKLVACLAMGCAHAVLLKQPLKVYLRQGGGMCSGTRVVPQLYFLGAQKAATTTIAKSFQSAGGVLSVTPQCMHCNIWDDLAVDVRRGIESDLSALCFEDGGLCRYRTLARRNVSRAMHALQEKNRCVVVIKPDLLQKDSEKEMSDGKEVMTTGKTLADDICSKFEDEYLEVKCRKQVLMTKDMAEIFFHYMSPSGCKAAVESFARGLCEVVVLEHLDDDVIDRPPKFVSEFNEQYGEKDKPFMFCSSSAWECDYYIEFFFPHLDALPVERTLALIKPDGVAKGTQKKLTCEQDAEAKAAAAGLFVVARRQLGLTADQAQLLCEGLDDPTGSKGVLVTGSSVAMLLEGPGAIKRWQLVCGPPNSGTAREIAPTTLRANWGTNSTSNAVHASRNMLASEKEVQALFPADSLKFQRTLCIIKPDAMPNAFEIRTEIQAAGFTILKEKEVKITEERAKEFYAKHQAKPYFNAMVKEAASGSCIVLVLCRVEAVAVLEQLIGPASVKEAKLLRPRSLRARYGRDGQRNAVHGSQSVKAAAVEVRFFFPEMGADPAPNGEEVRDFLFRKSAVASMELQDAANSDAITAGFNPDPALQQLLSEGLMALCQVQPRGKGLKAVKWLSTWLAENNPNTKQVTPLRSFDPPDRVGTYVAHSINKDGLAFSVEPSQPVKKKQIIDVDVSEETDNPLSSDFPTPPYVVFVTGGPGAGKSTACARLREDLNFVHLSLNDLMREEAAAGTYFGTEIEKHEKADTLNSDDGLKITLQLLKNIMIKHQDTNRFLIDDFPRTLKQAKAFEQQISSVAFILNFDAGPEILKQRANASDGLDKKIKDYETENPAILKYYGPIGKVRQVNAEKKVDAVDVAKSVDEVYAEVKKYLCCRFVYLLGPPGAPLGQVAEKMEGKCGYSAISLRAILARYIETGGPEAAKVKQALAKGKPVEASIACPLVVSEIFRDMALGVQNFVLCDFPQTAKQAQFLEHRVPCLTKPILLDFTRADAEDLASSNGGDVMEIEMQTQAFFGPDMQALIERLPNLTRVPCSLAGVASAVGSSSTATGREQKITDMTWSAVSPKVMPGLTIVLGPPGSGTDELAKMLTKLTPNTQAVDCNLLLDRELERRTEAGVTMHNMLARGQVVPLSMTLELLKDVVNLTCSDSLVIENCPLYVDQIEYITKEFRIDRVFFIDGSKKAIDEWQKSYAAKEAKAPEDEAREAQIFDSMIERLRPIVQHFARLGKLERIEVNSKPKESKLAEEIKKATLPQFAVALGLSPLRTSQLATTLAATYGVGEAITTDFLKNWALQTLERSVDPDDPKELFAALKKYADATNYPLLVLDRYPNNSQDAAKFVKEFGEPRVAFYLDSTQDDFINEEKKRIEDAGLPEEEDDKLTEKFEGLRKNTKDAYDAIKEKNPSAVLPEVAWNEEIMGSEGPKYIRDFAHQMCDKLRPSVYVIVAPFSGTFDFGALAADRICISKWERPADSRPAKYTVVNANSLVELGKHGAELNDRLAKVQIAAEAPDSLPRKLWIDLYKKAFSNSSNPMGTFLITGFPTPCAMTPFGPTIRDQFHLLDDAANIMGIFYVRFSDAAFKTCISANAEDLNAYRSFTDKLSLHVNKEGKGQFDSHRVCEHDIESADNLDDVLAKLADDFRGFQERAEQVPK